MSDAASLIEQQSFEGWAILELMGHRKLAGYVRQVEMFGGVFCRFDVPASDDDDGATQFYGASAIYCLTPTTEELATLAAVVHRPAPVTRWELPSPPKPSTPDRHWRDEE